VSYGYYRAFNTMLDHVQVLHDMALKAAKGNRFKELKKGTSGLCPYNLKVHSIFFKIPLLENINFCYTGIHNTLKLHTETEMDKFRYMYKNVAPFFPPSLLHFLLNYFCKSPDQ